MNFYICLHFSLSIVLALHVLYHKQSNVRSAWMWFMVIFFIPFAGAVLYLFFGFNSHYFFQRKMARIFNEFEKHRARLINHLTHQNQESLQNNVKSLMPYLSSVLDRQFPLNPLLGGNKVNLLHDGTQAYPQMLKAIKNAKKSIHLQSYLIMDDVMGNEFFAAMRERSNAGVKVRVLYDAVGSWQAGFKFFFRRVTTSSKGNFQIRAFSVWTLLTPWRLQYRNHRKALIVDGDVAFVGGLNIADENRRFNKKKATIHDLHSRVNGPIVNEIQYVFVRDWVVATKGSFEAFLSDDYFPKISPQGNASVRLIDSGANQNEHALEKLYCSAVNVAQKTVWLMTPYFVINESFTNQLISAVARGVEVCIILPKKNNHQYVYYAMCAQYNQLLESGVRIFEKGGEFTHAKAMLVDNAAVIMGSANCDERSFKLNYELALTIHEQDLAKELYNFFTTSFQRSEEVNLAQRDTISFRRKTLEAICNLLSPVL